MIIAIDFDGTLCEHMFPAIGEPNEKLINVLKELKAKDSRYKFILWTCRDDEFLEEAVEWCKKQGIILDAVNENVPELQNKDFAKKKIYADVYIDDRNMLIKDVEALKQEQSK